MTEPYPIKQMLRWLPRYVEPPSPLEFSALIYASLQQLEAEDWTEDIPQQRGKENAEWLMQYLSYLTVLAENFINTGRLYSPRIYETLGQNIGLLGFDQINHASMNKDSPWRDAAKTQMAIFHDETLFSQDFLTDTVALSAKRSFSLCDLIQNGRLFSGREDLPEILKEEMHHVNQLLVGTLLAMGHPVAITFFKNIYSPEQGPADIYSMRLFLLVYLCDVKLHEKEGVVFPENYNEAHEMLRATLPIFDNEMRDLPVDKVNEKINADYGALSAYAGQLYLDLQQLVGFIRYFVEHNDGKVSKDTTGFLAAITQRIFILTATRDSSLFDSKGTQLRDFWHTYQRPAPDKIAAKIIEEIEAKYSKRRAGKLTSKFERVRGLRPAGYREAVIFYYQDDEVIRAMRRTGFRISVYANGEDGHRTAYLKSVAERTPEVFRELGLSDNAIEHIRATGKIPINEETGKRYPITVDHICDREFGGINAHSNFTIMYDEDNLNKATLKRLQTMTLKNKEAGRWILTWVPENTIQVGTREDMFMSQMQPN